ncbi:hypothetical protein HXX25_04820 [Hyphobacterium sp. CCMP332]|uniref:hypothetical protein n=1 Tax=Hyphobacterium sp. CCMP332 TaxID=2749086 RepID=UPI001650A090|nr:hypothetical protein [Hyphobacterium sp. CCMP332]QNL18727.1 hypothetical protein HXX25_04820 [Hyphobacterium sp. CCMP332]
MAVALVAVLTVNPVPHSSEVALPVPLFPIVHVDPAPLGESPTEALAIVALDVISQCGSRTTPGSQRSEKPVGVNSDIESARAGLDPVVCASAIPGARKVERAVTDRISARIDITIFPDAGPRNCASGRT